MAVQQGANVDTLERLAVLREKFLAEKARKAYFDSLAAFQSECPVIVKSNRVIFSGSEKYRYAPIDKIIQTVGPLRNLQNVPNRVHSTTSSAPLRGPSGPTRRANRSNRGVRSGTTAAG